MTFKRLSIDESQALISAGNIHIADIRDKASYLSAHIENAQHVDNSNIEAFIAQANLDNPLLVYCYHGNSSQGAADFFASKGFKNTYSMDGGFELWRNQYAIVSE